LENERRKEAEEAAKFAPMMKMKLEPVAGSVGLVLLFNNIGEATVVFKISFMQINFKDEYEFLMTGVRAREAESEIQSSKLE